MMNDKGKVLSQKKVKTHTMLLTWNYMELFLVCTLVEKDKGRLILVLDIELWFISVLNLLKNIFRPYSSHLHLVFFSERFEYTVIKAISCLAKINHC